jgi:SAM-dependent methyltransferase
VKLDNPLVVQWEYASEERLASRNATYRALVEGVDPEALTFELVAARAPRDVLEVGCGMGELAERIGKETGARVQGLDVSERMVELTRERGVDVVLGDVQQLPYEDDAFDVVVANWVLYHVPDLARGVAELARVLRPDGLLVATTVGPEHMVELWALLGDAPTSGLSFDHDNGAAILGERFGQVERREANGTVVFPDRETMRQFVAATTTRSHLADGVPELTEPFETRCAHTMFLAEQPR